MTRGSTPTFVFTLPADVSVYTDIDIYFAQNGSVVLDRAKDSLTLSGNEVSFTMSEAESRLLCRRRYRYGWSPARGRYSSRRSGGSRC